MRWSIDAGGEWSGSRAQAGGESLSGRPEGATFEFTLTLKLKKRSYYMVP